MVNNSLHLIPCCLLAEINIINGPGIKKKKKTSLMGLKNGYFNSIDNYMLVISGIW